LFKIRAICETNRISLPRVALRIVVSKIAHPPGDHRSLGNLNSTPDSLHD
jgi:hypothetical protein